jgi:hypothetical protein
MNLLENAYDFLNESLRSADDARERPEEWKFAVLHVVQAIELLLKARLQAAHPVFIYENVDRPGNTVSLSQAVTRITGAARIQLTVREQRSIRKAQRWRDAIVHYEFEMSAYEVESVYVQLFEFLMRFHDEHTDFGTLHNRIEPSLWAKEAELMEFFRREFVVYNGVEVVRSWPAKLVAAQEEHHIDLHGRMFLRVRYGSEGGWGTEGWDSQRTCHDCAAVEGQYHVFGCDVEECPRCYRQLISCGCVSDEGNADSDLEPREVVMERLWKREPADGPG